MKTLLHFFVTLSVLLPLYAQAEQCEQTNNFSPDLVNSANNWNGWGNGLNNTRFAEDGINSAELDSLELAWAYGFENTGSVVGNPVVSGGRVFIGVDSGAVYALGTDNGCEHWIFQAEAGVRTAPALGLVNGTWTLFFGDRNTLVYAVNASNGQLLWKTKVETHAAAILTGSPQFVSLPDEEKPNRLIVPVSSSEEGLGAVPSYPCCSFRGNVVSLDASTGEIIWRTHTIEQEVSEQSPGKFGPSGAAIWSAPTVDIPGKTLFVTTGDAYSAPADRATDAVIAMDLVDGEMLWINQGTANDIWTVACMTPNAFPECGPDQDYGSPAMLVNRQGVEILIAGQKSGIVRAYNKLTGEMIWGKALVENTTEFGGKIIWGGASDGENVYFGMGNGSLASLRITDGALQWMLEISPASQVSTHIGFDGPVTISEDILFSGGWDGVLRAINSDTGNLVWEFNTVKEFQTVNDVPANGGSMGAAGPVIAENKLFVPSGYVGVKNGMPGNVLLVFKP